MIVYKFGGALARSKRGIEALVKILREASKREASRAKRKSAGTHGIVLVTSAIGHTTRHLARAAELAEEGRLAEAEDSLARTIEQHKLLADTLHLENEGALFDRLDSIANEIGAWLEGVAIVRELSARTRDAILASGERLASALIQAVLSDRGLAVHATPAAKVIVTDEHFGHAAPLVEEIERRAEKLIVPQLRKGSIVLVEGFAGATLDGLVTTMGSESSDLTATLLARALNAEEVVIWKVLPGLYTADPELVKTPKLIRTLSFDEAEEIGLRGSRILFSSFAHPITERDTLLRIATPFGHLSRHTTLQQEAPPARKTIALAAALETRLTLLSFRSPVVATTRREPQLAPLQAATERAVMTWSSNGEAHALVRKADWRSFARALPVEEIAHSKSIAALSLIIRKAESDDLFTLLAEMARSLKPFHLHALIPFERSLVAIIDEAESLPALRKLHHDMLE